MKVILAYYVKREFHDGSALYGRRVFLPEDKRGVVVASIVQHSNGERDNQFAAFSCYCIGDATLFCHKIKLTSLACCYKIITTERATHMIFATISNTIEKPTFTIEFKNIDIARGHWYDEKYIEGYLGEVETFLYDADKFNKNIIMHAFKLMQENHRIKDMRFYNVPDENKLIILAITDTKNFKEQKPFEKEMSITMKRQKFAFALIDLVDQDFKKLEANELKVPDSWVLNDELMAKFEKLRDLA